MIKFSNFCFDRKHLVLLVLGFAVLAGGCARDLGPIGGPDGLSALRPGLPGPTSFNGQNGWRSVSEPLLPGSGEIVPTGDRRWQGVAVYFAFDRSTVGAAERPKLEALATYLQGNPSFAVVIEGHTDDRGSDEYNRALSERRALAVKDYLVTLGTGAERLETLAYGEERPAVPNATSEEDHARNRRAEFIIGTRK
jgi:hypothetical protein